jgi:hypothetical protein
MSYPAVTQHRLLRQQLLPLLLPQELCQLFLQEVKLVVVRSQSSIARPHPAPQLLYSPLHHMHPLLQQDQQLL